MSTCGYTIVSCLLVSVLIAVEPSSTSSSWPECSRNSAVLKDIYRSLHESIKEHVVGCDSGEVHVELLNVGKPLKYDDFNPGRRKQLTFYQSSLPLSVVENALPLVDKIFPTDTTIKPASVNISESEKDYNFDSLSSTFSYILTHLMVMPKNFSDATVLRAKYYLQELVPNPERVLLNTSSLPRFLLYDYYRSLYLEESSKRDSQIDTKRLQQTQQMFEQWGQRELPPLMSNAEAAYMKWQVFGYKTEVENQLQYFDADSQEDKLMSTRALFRSMATSSERDHHITVYPFTLTPTDWYHALRASVAESADELRYRKSLLQAQQALLNASRNELNNITNEDIRYTLDTINNTIADLDENVRNAVDRLLQLEIECFTRVNTTACDMIINGHTAFRLILDQIAKHFEHASYLQSILDSKEESINILGQKLSEINGKISVLNSKIKAAEQLQIETDTEISSYTNLDSKSCPDTDRVHFVFNTTDTVLDCDSLDNSQNDNMPYCQDERVPINVSQHSLWNLASCSVDHELIAYNLHDNFSNLMNNAPAKITATLTKVDVHRPWFDEAIFRDWEHFTMKTGRGLVSPGPLEPPRYYQEIVRSGLYLMPQFTSSFILASDIKIFFPGLGVWNESNTNYVINILMKYTYAPNLEGGYGPFSFVPADGALNNVHSFRVDRSRGGILITVPGAQIIGYITKTIAKFPDAQPPLSNATSCQEEPSGPADTPTSKKRRRRSISEKDLPAKVDIAGLAKALFSEKLTENDSSLHRSGLIQSQSIQKLISEATASKDRVIKFMETLNTDEKEEQKTVLPLSLTQHDPASAYQNGTAAGITTQQITSK